MSFNLSDLQPDLAALARLSAELASEGLSLTNRADYLEVNGRDCIVEIQCRPRYCDRGRWSVMPRLAPGKSVVDLNLDAHDGFPRYYFGDVELVSELKAWMRARGQL